MAFRGTVGRFREGSCESGVRQVNAPGGRVRYRDGGEGAGVENSGDRQVGRRTAAAHGGPGGITFEWYPLSRFAPRGSTEEEPFERAPNGSALSVPCWYRDRESFPAASATTTTTRRLLLGERAISRFSPTVWRTANADLTSRASAISSATAGTQRVSCLRLPFLRSPGRGCTRRMNRDSTIDRGSRATANCARVEGERSRNHCARDGGVNS